MIQNWVSSPCPASLPQLALASYFVKFYLCMLLPLLECYSFPYLLSESCLSCQALLIKHATIYFMCATSQCCAKCFTYVIILHLYMESEEILYFNFTIERKLRLRGTTWLASSCTPWKCCSELEPKISEARFRCFSFQLSQFLPASCPSDLFLIQKLMCFERDRGTWLAPSIELGTLGLRVVSSNPMLVDIT